MILYTIILSLTIWLNTTDSCSTGRYPRQTGKDTIQHHTVYAKLIPGAYQTEKYTGLLAGKKVGLVVNQTSRINNIHLIDTLKRLGVNIAAVFAPEHGLRGDSGDGIAIQNGIDKQTGAPVISLYGKTKKPTAGQMQGIDLMVYDIQDVGVRFYTYISTLHYVMEACAETDKPLLILDRPDPNDGYIDGPVLDTNFRSFVGMHPIPVVYSLTPGELASMINGEGWLKNKEKCSLTVIPLKGYKHGDTVNLNIPPSPNLTNNKAISLYPSLCWLEATPVSIGRGTPWPFQIIGYPDKECGAFSFTPEPISHASPNPPQKGKQCYGLDLRYEPVSLRINLTYFFKFYQTLDGKIKFIDRPDFFDKLAGTNRLRLDIENGLNEDEIRKSWEEEINSYKQKRKKYLLYQDFTD